MATIKQKFLIHAIRCGEGYTYELMRCDMSEYGYIPICDQEVSFEVPDGFNPIPAEIEMLQKKKQQIQADAQVKANAIDEQIGKLLCLEHKPEGEVL